MKLKDDMQARNYLIKKLKELGYEITNEQKEDWFINGKNFRIDTGFQVINEWKRIHNYNIARGLAIISTPYCYNKDCHRRIDTFDLINGDYSLLKAKIDDCIKVGEINEKKQKDLEDTKEKAKIELASKLKGIAKKNKYEEWYIDTPYFKIEFDATTQGIKVNLVTDELSLEQAIELYKKVK